MATVGAILKTRREELKLSLEDVSIKTKVGLKFLAAIENEEFDLLPPMSYSIGFVKLYATAIGLEAGPVVAQFKRESRPMDNAPMSAEESLPDRDIVKKVIPSWILIAIIAFLLMVAIASYGWLRATPQAKIPVNSSTSAESTSSGTSK